MPTVTISKPRAGFKTGAYDAVVEACEEAYSQVYDKQQWQVTFKITEEDDEADGRTIRTWITRYFDGAGNEIVSKGTRSFELLQAIHPGEDLDVGEEFTLGPEIVGKPLIINIKTEEKAGKEIAKVSAMMPRKRRKGSN